MARVRWAAFGATVALLLGVGGAHFVDATNPSSANAFVPIAPCRLVDTRSASNVGHKNTPLFTEQTMTVPTRPTADNPTAGNCTGSIPNSARGVALNVTAIGATEATFLTLWPANESRPDSSSLNPVPGSPPTPNSVIVGLSDGGQFKVYNLAGRVDVVIDATGYFVDHSHDDRYYRATQIDEMMRLTPIAGGFVAANGTLGRHVRVVSSTWNATDLQYEIELEGINYSNIEYATMVSPYCGGADANADALVIPSSNNKLIVRVETSVDALGQCGFSFLVTRLPAG